MDQTLERLSGFLDSSVTYVYKISRVRNKRSRMKRLHSTFFSEGPSPLSVVLPPHLRCAAHTLSLVASKDSEAALDDPAFRTASRSMFAKASAFWNKQSRTVTAAENINDATGRQLVVPNQTRRNSTFDAVKCLHDQSPDKICDSLGLPRFSSRDHLFVKEFVMLMGPLAKSLDYLQGDRCVGLGSLLPQLGTLKCRIEQQKGNLEICRPLAAAVLRGVESRFKEAYEDGDTLLAAVSDPRCKLLWTADLAQRKKGRLLLAAEVANLKRSVTTSGTPTKCTSGDEDFLVFDDTTDMTEATTYLQEGLAQTLHELDKHPSVKAVFLRCNTVLSSSGALDRLFSQAVLILTRNRARVRDFNFEAKVLFKFNSNKDV